MDFGSPVGGWTTKWNNSTSKESKVRSRWGGADLKGGVDFSILFIIIIDKVRAEGNTYIWVSV